MIDLERELHALRDSLDFAVPPDLLHSVRRRHARVTLRRRSAVAAVTVLVFAVGALPRLVSDHRGGASAQQPAAATADPSSPAASSEQAPPAATSEQAPPASAEPVTKASLDAALATIAARPRADEPQPNGTFAYTHTVTRYVASMPANPVESPSGTATCCKDLATEPMFSYLSGTDRGIWQDKLSAGHRTTKALPPIFFHPGDAATYKKLVGKENDSENDLTNGGDPTNVPNPSFNAAALPLQPAAMRAYLQAVPSGVDDVNERTFTAGMDLLSERVFPTKVRVAVLRALLLIPDVTVVENVADLSGRVGVGIGRVERGTTRRDVIVNDTGSVLGIRETVVVAGEYGPAGTIVGHTAILDSGFVDKVGDTPPAR